MLECYNFEECEYNAQPKCCLPNGMECPHGVKAHKPTNADHEKLIERLKNAAGGPEDIKMCQDAATALSTLQTENEGLKEKLYDGEGVNLVDYWMQQAKIEENGHRNCQAENEKLRAELEQVKRALAMMWFSYVNSDKEMPHSYETEALDEAERILGPWAECLPKYLRRGPKED